MSDAAAPLVRAAGEDRLHHALILHGPVVRELRESAVAIARALNCEQTTGDDGCVACRRIDQGIHPDVHLIEVRDDRKMISIEQVRELVSAAALRPYEGRNKVFIIDPVDAISLQGANALLKTLEEPASSTVFLLLTRAPDRLLQTIRSRSQIVAIRPRARYVPASEAERLGVSLQEARIIASAPSDGDAGPVREIVGEILEFLYRWAHKRDTTALLGLAAYLSIHADPVAAGGFYLSVMRDLLGTHPNDAIDPGRFEEIQTKIALDRIHASSRAMAKAVDMLSVNVDARTAFEGAVLELVPPRR